MLNDSELIQRLFNSLDKLEREAPICIQYPKGGKFLGEIGIFNKGLELIEGKNQIEFEYMKGTPRYVKRKKFQRKPEVNTIVKPSYTIHNARSRTNDLLRKAKLKLADYRSELMNDNTVMPHVLKCLYSGK